MAAEWSSGAADNGKAKERLFDNPLSWRRVCCAVVCIASGICYVIVFTDPRIFNVCKKRLERGEWSVGEARGKAGQEERKVRL